MTGALVVLALLQTPLDQGTFIVRHDSLEVAREVFRLTAGPLGRAPAGCSCTIVTQARYDRHRPVVGLSAIVELGPDTQPRALQYDVTNGGAARILGERVRDRFTVRHLSRDSERARDFPTTGRIAVLDDSLFALYAAVAWLTPLTGPPVAFTAVFARALRREALELRPLGPAETVVGGDLVTLEHLVVTGGAAGVVHVWIDPDGRLMKVEIPDRGWVAERAAGG